MEKRSRRRIRDLVTQLASQGLSENENGRARISMMAKSNERSTHGPDTEAQDQSPPSLTSGLQHTKSDVRVMSVFLSIATKSRTSHHVGSGPLSDIRL
jgi:hypothetical protein